MKKKSILLLPFLILGLSLAACTSAKKSNTKPSGGDEPSGGQTTTVAVTGVSLNKSSLDLTVGDTETLVATVAPSNATNKNVTWESSNAAVASVANGLVTALAEGNATVTVKTVDGNKTATCAVAVSAAPAEKTLQSLSVSGYKENYEVGDELGDLTVVANYSDGTHVNLMGGYTVTGFDSSAAAEHQKVTVTYQGVSAEFYVNIVAKTTPPEPQKVYTVKFGDASPVTLSKIDKDPDESADILEKYKGSASVTAGQSITFKLNDEVIKPGDENQDGEPHNGNNTAGNWTDGYVVHNDAEADVYLKVYADGYSFWLTGYEAGDDPVVPPTPTTPTSYIHHGHDGVEWENVELKVNPNNENEVMATGVQLPANEEFVICASENNWKHFEDAKNEAAVLAGDIVQGEEGTGGHNFKVANAGKYDFYVETFENGQVYIAKQAEAPATVSVTGVSLNKNASELYVEDEEQLVATVLPENATNKNVTWSVSEGTAVTVNNSGLVTAVAAGTAKVKVTTEDGSKTAECTFTVSEKPVDLQVTSITAEYKGGDITVGETLNGEQLFVTKHYNTGLEADLTSAEYATLKFYEDEDCLHEIVDAANYKFEVAIPSLTIYVKFGELKANFNVTVVAAAAKVYSGLINATTQIEFTDASSEPKGEDTWVEQYKATITVAKDDALTFKYGDDAIAPGASGTGNNLNPEGLKVLTAGTNLTLYLKVYDNAGVPGYDLWLTGYKAPAVSISAFKLVHGAAPEATTWQYANGVVGTVHASEDDNVKEQLLYVVELVKDEGFKLWNGEEGAENWLGRAFLDDSVTDKVSAKDAGNGDITANVAVKLDVYLKLYNDDTKSIYVGEHVDPINYDEWKAVVNTTDKAVVANPSDPNEIKLEVELAANDKVVFTNGAVTLNYANVKDGCAALFDDGTSHELVVKAAGTYTFYVNIVDSGKVIWAEKAVDPSSLLTYTVNVTIPSGWGITDIYDGGAKVYVWAWGGTYGSGTWVETTKVAANQLTVKLDNTCTGFKVVRLSDTTTTPTWDNKWNESDADIVPVVDQLTYSTTLK